MYKLSSKPHNQHAVEATLEVIVNKQALSGILERLSSRKLHGEGLNVRNSPCSGHNFDTDFCLSRFRHIPTVSCSRYVTNSSVHAGKASQ